MTSSKARLMFTYHDWLILVDIVTSTLSRICGDYCAHQMKSKLYD